MKRFKLLLILSLMPDEAFSWFVSWAVGNYIQYPDGLGGFTSESRESVSELRAAAKEYLGG